MVAVKKIGQANGCEVIGTCLPPSTRYQGCQLLLATWQKTIGKAAGQPSDTVVLSEAA